MRPGGAEVSVAHHDHPDAFLAAAGPLLARDPAVRAFVVAWLATWRRDAARARPTYAATYANGSAHGLALHREGPLVIQNSDAVAAVAFADDLLDRRIALDHVIGQARGCAAFAGAWSRRTGRGHQVAMRMRHHMLTRVAPVTIGAGLLRTASSVDLPWLTRHALGFVRDAHLPDRPDQVRASVRRRVAEGSMSIWCDGEGRRVAFASCAQAGPGEARIGLVYTLPRRRGQGHAMSLVASIARERLASGAQRLFLVTDLDNRTSNALYARIGFRPVSDQVQLTFRTGERETP